MQPSPAHHLAWNNNNTFHDACRPLQPSCALLPPELYPHSAWGWCPLSRVWRGWDGNSSEVVNKPGLAPIPERETVVLSRSRSPAGVRAGKSARNHAQALAVQPRVSGLFSSSKTSEKLFRAPEIPSTG